MTLIRIDDPAPGIRRFTLDRPERRNAMSLELRAELLEAVEAALADEQIRAMVVTGAGGHFSAGGDITSMGGHDELSGRARLRRSHRLLRLLVEAEKPLVAAIEGYAMGAGAGLALCADTIVAGQGAIIGFPFFRIGLVPDFGIFYTLPRRVGLGPARQILLYARSLPAPEARAVGLVDEVVADAEVQETALVRAQELAAQPLHAFRLAKAVLNRFPQDLESALEAETMAQTLCMMSADHQEGAKAFLEKRKPRFG